MADYRIGTFDEALQDAINEAPEITLNNTEDYEPERREFTRDDFLNEEGIVQMLEECIEQTKRDFWNAMKHNDKNAILLIKDDLEHGLLRQALGHHTANEVLEAWAEQKKKGAR